VLILALPSMAHGQVFTLPIAPARQQAKPAPSPLAHEIRMLDLLEEETITNGEAIISLGGTREPSCASKNT
jgi:hypothetical protein